MTRLRELRSLTGITLTTFAIRNGLEPSLLSLIERGKRPSRRTADKLAAALGVAPDVVFPEYQTLKGKPHEDA